MEAETQGVVYLLGSPGSPHVKIGWTRSLEHRAGTIQRMSPVPLTVLWFFSGSRQDEAQLHRHFAHLRAHGEWFDFGQELDPVAAVQAARSEIDRANVEAEAARQAKQAARKKAERDRVAEARRKADRATRRAESEDRRAVWKGRQTEAHQRLKQELETRRCSCGHLINKHTSHPPHHCLTELLTDEMLGAGDLELVSGWTPCSCAGYDGAASSETRTFFGNGSKIW